MGKGPKQTLLQRGHTNGQQTNEKMFNATNHERNAMRYHLTVSEWLSSIDQPTSGGEGVEKGEHFHTVGGNADWCSHCGKQYGDISKK